MAQRVTEVTGQPRLRRSPLARLGDLWHQAKKEKTAYLFVAPFTIIFLVFMVIPVIAGFILSFTYFNLLEPPEFIGWTNYQLLFLEDDIFLTSVKNTLIYAVIVGPGGFMLSLVLAWLINSLKYRVGYTLIFYAPSVVSGIAISGIWKIFFSGDRYGWFNYWLIQLGILNEPIIWLQDVIYMMPIVIGVALWMSMGVNFLVFLAGLQDIDPQLYEAGKIDGVRHRFQEFWYITLPLLKPQLLFGAVMQTVAAFRAAGIAIALTGLPSPLYATHTMLSHLMDHAFIRFEMGYGSAISTVLFILTFSLSRVFMRVFSTKGQY